MNCPHCGRTQRYTDPLLQVRCIGCFNVLNDQPPGTPAGAVQDLSAPIQIVNYFAPREQIHYGR